MLSSSKRFSNVLAKSVFCERFIFSTRNSSIAGKNEELPDTTDIVIIGGGAMGSSTAYWLGEKSKPNSPYILVVEKDMTFSNCSTTLSVGGLRQQFTLPENILMSSFGIQFIRSLKERFGKDADVSFTPNGYLMLASEKGAAQLIENSKLQHKYGAINTILNKYQLKERFAWLNVSDIEVGCLGLQNEGWLDPWALLRIFKQGAKMSNVKYVTGEAVGFTFKGTGRAEEEEVHGSQYGIHELLVKLPSGETKPIKFSTCVLAAGADSGNVAKLANIGNGPGILKTELPVERRKRYVYCFNCQDDTEPGLNSPLTVDCSGAYFRRESAKGSYICGKAPLPDEEPETDNFEVDYSYFDNTVWPLLANRVPAFNNLKVRGAWAGFYEHNTFDRNGVIGMHPYFPNLYIAAGFSGHGIQQSPAVGRAIAELILDGSFQTIDLRRLGFDRFIENRPMLEINIV